MTGRLYIRAKDHVALDAAAESLAKAQPRGDAVALVYAPQFCAFARLTSRRRLQGPPDAKFRGPDGPDRFHDRVLAEAYEVRLFCKDWELRWLRDGASGRAALLAGESGLAPDVFGDSVLEPEEPDRELPAKNADARNGALNNCYLLWGERGEPSEDEKRLIEGDWTKLTSARIGALWVPFRIEPPARRIQLTTREYWRRGVSPAMLPSWRSG
jgi:CRISPR-associated protein (TIGR03984 family)